MNVEVPSVEAFDSLCGRDFLGDGEGADARFGFMHFLRFQLNDHLDHIDGLSDVGGKHTREAADDEGLDSVKESNGSGPTDRPFCRDTGHNLFCWDADHKLLC